MPNSKLKSHSIKFMETNIACFERVAHAWIYGILLSKFINAWEKLVHVQSKILISHPFFFSAMSFTKKRPTMEWLILNFCALVCLNSHTSYIKGGWKLSKLLKEYFLVISHAHSHIPSIKLRSPIFEKFF